MSLINPDYTGHKGTILKKSKTGLEAEFFLVDNKGYINHNASKVIDEVKKKNKKIPIVPESGKNLIEFTCYPHVVSYYPALDLIHSIETTMDVCKKLDTKLFPFGTYPGKFDPVFYNKDVYKMKEKIFGPEKFKNAPRVSGFHHHYSLPKGVFDSENLTIKVLKKSKLANSLMSSYNFDIAADPALTLLLQSSPLFQGEHFSKDSKMVMYRGGKKLQTKLGLWSRHQQIGGMPPYKQTVTDHLSSIQRRWTRWKREIKKVDPRVDMNKLYPSKLDIFWGPVRMNKVGTLEERGLDENMLSLTMSTSVLLTSCLRLIQRKFIEVIPADFAIEEPFKFENGIIYVPPHTHLRNKLQKWSAYKGYQKKEMHSYVSKFYKLAKSHTPKKYYKLLKPIEDMIENKRSMSDKILKYAKYKKYLDENKINDSDSAELALHYAEIFQKDLKVTKEEILKIAK